MRVIFAGTPDFAVAALRALHAQHDIVAVFTQPDRKAGRGKKLNSPPVKIIADKLGLKVHQPHNLNDQYELIQELGADVMVVVAYGVLLPQKILDLPKHGCINIHASLLPRWRGAAPIQRSIEAGDSHTGVSIMRMELGLDTGPVYQMIETPISNRDTSTSLHDRLSKLGAEGVCDTLASIELDPNLLAIEQSSSNASYAKKIFKSEALIDWSASASAIDRKVRAFMPWPICQSEHQGQRIRIWQASVHTVPNQDIHSAGEILELNDEYVLVACGKDALRLEILQRDGSKPLAAKEFCNGYSLQPGDLFGLNGSNT